MATFTVAPAKQRPMFDANVFSKRPGIDYRARADEAWREIEDTLDTLDTVHGRYVAVSERHEMGMEWVGKNHDHQHYLDGVQLLNEVYNELVGLAINLRGLRRVIWNQCCTLYAALHHCDREAWLTEHDAEFDALHPDSIWNAVVPGHPPPGSWPEVPSEKYIERKVSYMGWQARKDGSE